MADKIEKILSSTLQHGKENDRIYLLKVNSEENIKELIIKAEELAHKNNYGKIIAKIRERQEKHFLKEGYLKEAFIPNFYAEKETTVFMSKFISPQRSKVEITEAEKIEKIIQTAKEKGATPSPLKTPPNISFRKAVPEDAKEIVEVYKVVFESYPFPIHDPEYIKKTMASHIDYYVALDNKKVIAVSSAEIDYDNRNAEMTDFATYPDFRGQGLALILLHKMEADLPQKNIKTFYTIARAISFGMNITFAKAGYEYTGTLKNNTNICGRIESMNIWHKSGL